MKTDAWVLRNGKIKVVMETKFLLEVEGQLTKVFDNPVDVTAELMKSFGLEMTQKPTIAASCTECKAKNLCPPGTCRESNVCLSYGA